MITLLNQDRRTVKINTHGGSIRMLKNVRYVQNLRRNIISTGTSNKLGCKHEGGDGKVRFYKDTKTALRGNLVNVYTSWMDTQFKMKAVMLKVLKTRQSCGTPCLVT